jgi:hypothetical protein
MNLEKQLHESIEKENYAECKKLLQFKPNIVNNDYNKKYPLYLSCEKDNYSIVKLLIEVFKLNFILILLKNNNIYF